MKIVCDKLQIDLAVPFCTKKEKRKTLESYYFFLPFALIICAARILEDGLCLPNLSGTCLLHQQQPSGERLVLYQSIIQPSIF